MCEEQNLDWCCDCDLVNINEDSWYPSARELPITTEMHERSEIGIVWTQLRTQQYDGVKRRPHPHRTETNGRCHKTNQWRTSVTMVNLCAVTPFGTSEGMCNFILIYININWNKTSTQKDRALKSIHYFHVATNSPQSSIPCNYAVPFKPFSFEKAQIYS